MIWKVLFGITLVLLVISLTVTGLAIQWAKTTTSTAAQQLEVERGNVQSVKDYGSMMKKALDEKTKEYERLRAELKEAKSGGTPLLP